MHVLRTQLKILMVSYLVFTIVHISWELALQFSKGDLLTCENSNQVWVSDNAGGNTLLFLNDLNHLALIWILLYAFFVLPIVRGRLTRSFAKNDIKFEGAFELTDDSYDDDVSDEIIAAQFGKPYSLNK